MNGSIAQVCALTCHANAYLAGQRLGAFFPDNSTCRFCDEVNFVIFKKTLVGKMQEKQLAHTPDEWFSVLKAAGALGVRLATSTREDPTRDRRHAGFVGGGRVWSMEVVFPHHHSDYWMDNWYGWTPAAPDRRIWRVTYGRVASGPASVMHSGTLTAAMNNLTAALRDIHGFAERHSLEEFTQCFAHALDTIDSRGQSLHGYHVDLAPDGLLCIEARTLLDACQTSWVFHGMGSWNDMLFHGDKQQEYDRVSDQLFSAIHEAIVAGVNSTYPQSTDA